MTSPADAERLEQIKRDLATDGRSRWPSWQNLSWLVDEVERLRQREATLRNLLADVESDHARHEMLDPACSNLHGRIMAALAQTEQS